MENEAGNRGYTGNMYTGIPAGSMTFLSGMSPEVYDANKMLTDEYRTGGSGQLPAGYSFLQAANYFLMRNKPYKVAPYPSDMKESWGEECDSSSGCFDPPAQFCRSLQCLPGSYPVSSSVCVSAKHALEQLDTSLGTA